MKRFKVKNIFSSLLSSYIAILLLPFCLLIILMVYSEKQAESKSINGLANALGQGVELFAGDLEECKNSAAALAYDPMLRILMKKERVEEADQDIEKMAQYNDKLNEAFSKSSFYHDYAVLLKNGLTFRSSGMSVGKKFFYENYRNYEECSYEDWENVSFFSLVPGFIPLQTITINGLKEKSFTMLYPIRNVADMDGQAEASVQFLIYEKQLREQFAQVLDGYPETSVFVLPGEGDCLIDLSEGEQLPEGLADRALLSEESGSFSVKWQGEKQLVIYREEKETGLLFAAMIPFRVATESAREFGGVSLFLFLCLLLTELLIGIQFAVRYSAPIRNIMLNITRVFEPEIHAEELKKRHTLDEYGFLSESVNRLILSNQEMKRYNFMLLLCSGEFENEEAIRAEGRSIGIVLESRRYFIGVTVLKNPEGLSKLMGEEWTKPVLCHFVQKNSELTVLFGLEEQTEEEVKESILSCKQRVDEATGEATVWGIGKECDRVTELFLSYRQAVSCVSNKENVAADGITYYMQMAGEKYYFWYPAEVEEGLINATKYGERTALKSIFEKIKLENCGKRHLEAQIGQILLSRLIDTFCRICNDVVCSQKMEEVTSILQKKDSLAESIDLLCQKFMELCDGQADFRNRHDEAFYQQLVQYIENNYQDSQLCIARAAEKFSLSENYFSQFFKNIVGESFSTYLEKVRTGNAKKMLEENRYDMETIAEKVGYNNSASFRRAFKRTVGISPSVWKKENGIAEENGTGEREENSDAI